MAVPLDTLDTTRNQEYDPVTGIMGIKCKATYTNSLEFKTEIDEHFSGHEQRRDSWSSPRRSWLLEFEKHPTTSKYVDEFFIRQRGRYKAFLWTWAKSINGDNFGGDGKQYRVRFNTDKLDFQIKELGYSTFSLEIVEVKS